MENEASKDCMFWEIFRFWTPKQVGNRFFVQNNLKTSKKTSRLFFLYSLGNKKTRPHLKNGGGFCLADTRCGWVQANLSKDFFFLVRFQFFDMIILGTK